MESLWLLGHLSGQRLTGGAFWQLGRFLGEAVVVFFVLSGFVISFAMERRDGTPGAYALSRASRVLSVAVPALVLTFALDTLGRALAPGLYTAAWGYQPRGRALQFLAGLFFVNQVWFLDLPPGSDLPYWSLGFEVWYYVVFGLVAFRRAGWGALAALVAGPRILCLFPLWLLGVGAHRLCRRGWPGGQAAGWLLAGGAMLAWAAAEAAFWRPGWPSLPVPAPFRSLDLLHSYVVGLLIAGTIVGLEAASGPTTARVAARLARPVRWLAGATFSLYLFHLPVAQALRALSPWPAASPSNRALVLGGTVAAVFLLAQVTERRREPWRRALSRLRAPMRALAGR